MIAKSAERRTRIAKPMLAAGMRLRQPEFHRRYEQYQDDTKFELIEGEVFMASPAGDDHGEGTFSFSGLLCFYLARTPGIAGGSNMTAILGWDSEPQPDNLLRILPEYGGHSSLNQKGYLVGPPELVCEVSVTTQHFDLGKKLDMYERYGIQEYVVYDKKGAKLHWHQFPARTTIDADVQGIYKSQVFPGLWVDSKALIRGDIAGLLATVERGCKTVAHRKFVANLRSMRR